MADVDVVPKRRTNVWIWIRLALVIAAVLFMLVAAGRADASTAVPQYSRTIPPLSNAPANTLLVV